MTIHVANCTQPTPHPKGVSQWSSLSVSYGIINSRCGEAVARMSARNAPALPWVGYLNRAVDVPERLEEQFYRWTDSTAAYTPDWPTRPPLIYSDLKL